MGKTYLIKHEGVMGMHWGIHKAEPGAKPGIGPGKSRGTSTPGKIDINKETQKSLNEMYKKAKQARDVHDWSLQVTAEDKYIKAFDAMGKKQMADIDNGPGNFLTKGVKKFFKGDAMNREFMRGIDKTYNDVDGVIREGRKKRTAAEFEGERKLYIKYEKIQKERDAAREKLPFGERLSQFLKDDKEISDMYAKDLLKNSIENA